MVQIGGGAETLRMIEKGIMEAPTVKRRRILTWVAYRMLDSDVAQVWLETRAKKADGKAAEALKAAAEEVTKGDKLLWMAE